IFRHGSRGIRAVIARGSQCPQRVAGCVGLAPLPFPLQIIVAIAVQEPGDELRLPVDLLLVDRKAPLVGRRQRQQRHALIVTGKASAIFAVPNRTCFACHNQGVPLLALTAADERGFTIDKQEIDRQTEFIARFLNGNRDNYLQGKGQGGQADTAGYALWALAAAGYDGTDTTAAVTEY